MECFDQIELVLSGSAASKAILQHNPAAALSAVHSSLFCASRVT